MTTTRGSTTENSGYLADFSLLEKNRASNGVSWVNGIREAAIHRFSELGLPTTRDERWKFTNVAPIEKASFRRLSPSIASGAPRDRVEEALRGTSSPRLVFVNGIYRADLSTPRAAGGVFLGGLAETLKSHGDWLEPHLARYASFEDHAFVALNTAFLEDGAFVRVAEKTIVEEPIHLCFVSTDVERGFVSHPRLLVIVEEGAQARIVESYVGVSDAPYFTNAVTEVVVGAGAVLDHTKLERESAGAYHVATLQVVEGRSASYTSHSIALGGALVRNDLNAVLDGDGADCILDGLYVIGGKQHVDNHTLLVHAQPHCSSRELYKGVLDGQSRGVFSGRILVRPGAQKTDAKQTNKNLLLSNDALVNTMPQLEIYADDVKCTHGATIGRLDEDALFYLRSRGIGGKEARGLLIDAFMGEMIGRIKDEGVRSTLGLLLGARLRNGAGKEGS